MFYTVRGAQAYGELIHSVLCDFRIGYRLLSGGYADESRDFVAWFEYDGKIETVVDRLRGIAAVYTIGSPNYHGMKGL